MRYIIYSSNSKKIYFLLSQVIKDKESKNIEYKFQFANNSACLYSKDGDIWKALPPDCRGRGDKWDICYVDLDIPIATFYEQIMLQKASTADKMSYPMIL